MTAKKKNYCILFHKQMQGRFMLNWVLLFLSLCAPIYVISMVCKDLAPFLYILYVRFSLKGNFQDFTFHDRIRVLVSFGESWFHVLERECSKTALCLVNGKWIILFDKQIVFERSLWDWFYWNCFYFLHSFVVLMYGFFFRLNHLLFDSTLAITFNN